MTTYGRYEVLDRLGAGSTGTVFRARSVEDGRVVAIKELAGALREQPGAVDRLRREATVLRGLTHPNIVGLHEFVEQPDRSWLVCEYVEGASLSAVLATHGQLAPESALMVLRGALTGLAFAHQRGVLHGDISLDNILLTTDGTSKLLDFGLAAPVGGTTTAGTPAFLSPEAITGGPRTPAADVYSAAAVLFTLLAGRPPFPGNEVAAVFRDHLTRRAPTVDGHGPELAGLLDRALAKDPARRPADAAVLLALLEDAAARRYGADWPVRASLGGLATAATGAHLAAPVAAAITGAPASVAAHVAAGAAATGARRLTRSRLTWIVSGVAAAAAAAVVATVALAAGPGDGDAGRPATALAQDATATPAPTTPTPVPATLPEGTYTAVMVVTVGDPNWEEVGVSKTRAWPITLDCVETACTGSAPTENGIWTMTFDGTTMQVSGATEYTTDCFDEVTGELVPGTSFTAAQDFTATLTAGVPAVAGERPVLTGTMQINWRTVTTTGNCQVEPDGATTRDITLTPA